MIVFPLLLLIIRLSIKADLERDAEVAEVMR